MTSPTAIHCPSCDRYLMKAEEIKAGELPPCKSCGARLMVNLGGGKLTVERLEPTASAPS